MDSLCRNPFSVDGSLSGKQEITEVSAEAKYDGQSLQEATTNPYIVANGSSLSEFFPKRKGC